MAYLKAWESNGDEYYLDAARDGVSPLADGQTRSAFQFVMCTDATFDLENAKIHQSTMFGIDALLATQFPIGAFPQGWWFFSEDSGSATPERLGSAPGSADTTFVATGQLFPSTHTENASDAGAIECRDKPVWNRERKFLTKKV